MLSSIKTCGECDNEVDNHSCTPGTRDVHMEYYYIRMGKGPWRGVCHQAVWATSPSYQGGLPGAGDFGAEPWQTGWHTEEEGTPTEGVLSPEPKKEGAGQVGRTGFGDHGRPPSTLEVCVEGNGETFEAGWWSRLLFKIITEDGLEERDLVLYILWKEKTTHSVHEPFPIEIKQSMSDCVAELPSPRKKVCVLTDAHTQIVGRESMNHVWQKVQLENRPMSTSKTQTWLKARPWEEVRNTSSFLPFHRGTSHCDLPWFILEPNSLGIQMGPTADGPGSLFPTAKLDAQESSRERGHPSLAAWSTELPFRSFSRE
jgi:hypothetical protein